MATKRKPVTLTPRTANTTAKLCRLRRDNIDSPEFWILVAESSVTIAQQRNGEPAKTSITIPKRVFNRFVDFYNGASERAAAKRAGRTTRRIGK